MNVLVSVSNKIGLVGFMQQIKALMDKRGEPLVIVSTGGTATILRDEGGLTVQDVATVTGFPEILGGRVKSLHPLIHGALLCRPDLDEDNVEMQQHKIEPIDMVIVNLYPFAETTAKPGCTFDKAIENIDIGGPSMLRSAAKNHERVTVISDLLDYPAIFQELEATGGICDETRLWLAKKAFRHTSAYDHSIANYLSDRIVE